MSDTTESNRALGAMIIALMLLAPLLIYGLWVEQTLWSWFLLPQFGLAVPTKAMLLGLSTVIQLICCPKMTITTIAAQLSQSDKMDSMGQLVRSVCVAFIVPTVSLLIGFVARGFMP